MVRELTVLEKIVLEFSAYARLEVLACGDSPQEPCGWKFPMHTLFGGA